MEQCLQNHSSQEKPQEPKSRIIYSGIGFWFNNSINWCGSRCGFHGRFGDRTGRRRRNNRGSRYGSFHFTKIISIGIQIIPKHVDLKVLDIDNVPKSAFKVFDCVKLSLCGVLHNDFGHVDSIDVVRNHLLHESNNFIRTIRCGFHFHLFVHLTINSLETLLEMSILRTSKKLYTTFVFSTSSVLGYSSGTAIRVKCIVDYRGVKSLFLCVACIVLNDNLS
mmetsp:Transcript_43394/g.52083  ORF Transcript_43394/g.52083 Transcript_43394/m.52083 type:complete len:221 (-) Transcript_43394:205-867(-)